MVVFLFHAVTILVLLITTYAYYQQTGATLEYGHVMVLISELDEIVPILARNVPLLIWGLFVIGLFYLTLGPWLLRYALKARQGWPEGPKGGTLELSSSLIPLGFLLLALSSGSLSVLTATNALARTICQRYLARN